MIRFLRSFLWLRWRLLVNGLRGGRRRDRLERLSRFAAVAVPGIVLGVVLLASALVSVFAYLGAARLAAGTLPPGLVLLVVRLFLLLELLVLAFIPLGGGHGEVAGSPRLLLLPVPRRALHLVEVLASLGNPWVVFIAPPLVVFAVGLQRGGQSGTALVALAAAAAFLALLGALGSLLSFVLSWLMRGRRRAEAFSLVFVLLLSFVGLVPVFLSERAEHKARSSQRAQARGGEALVEQIDRALPVWTRAIPSELYGRAVGRAAAGRHELAWLGVGALALEAAALYGLSAGVHRRLLGTTASGGGRRRSAVLPAAGRRLPGLSAAASAVAVAQARSALRSVRGRLGVMMPGPLVAGMTLISRQFPGEFPGGETLGAHGHVTLAAALFFSFYTSLAFLMNQFAVDRGGLARHFLAPIPFLELIKGKAAGCALIVGAAGLLGLVCALAVAPGGSPLVWLAVLLGAVATYLLLLPFAVLLSGLFPLAADLAKTGTAGGPHGLSLLLGTLLVGGLAAVPAAIVGVAHHVLSRPGLALLLMAAWTLAAAGIAPPLVRRAARDVERRRETLLLVAAGR